MKRNEFLQSLLVLPLLGKVKPKEKEEPKENVIEFPDSPGASQSHSSSSEVSNRKLTLSLLRFSPEKESFVWRD